MRKYIDIHSHLNFPQFDSDRNDVLDRMREEDVATIIVGTNTSTSQEAVGLARENEGLWACVGLHPVDEDERAFDKHVFSELCNDSSVVAIGETGLDYFHAEESDKARQVEVFRSHIELALMRELPLMIHCRDAYADTLSILEGYHGRGLRGNIHFFAGERQDVDRVLDLGFSLSFTGVVTFVEEYADLVQYVPLDRMMAETDAPFVAPAPMRGRRNESVYVKHIYERIAEIRGEDKEVVRAQLTKNALNFFRI